MYIGFNIDPVLQDPTLSDEEYEDDRITPRKISQASTSPARPAAPPSSHATKEHEGSCLTTRDVSQAGTGSTCTIILSPSDAATNTVPVGASSAPIHPAPHTNPVPPHDTAISSLSNLANAAGTVTVGSSAPRPAVHSNPVPPVHILTPYVAWTPLPDRIRRCTGRPGLTPKERTRRDLTMSKPPTMRAKPPQLPPNCQPSCTPTPSPEPQTQHASVSLCSLLFRTLTQRFLP